METKKQKEKIAKVMHEFKEGELHIGKSDKIVKNPKQAVAIALSQANASKMADGGGVGSSEYYIFEGYDHFKSKPLYKVSSKVNEYNGEWHTDRKDAELELKSLLNNPKKDSFTYSIGGL